MNLSCFTTGFLGWELGLSLKQSILTTIFGTLLGSMLTVSDGEMLCRLFTEYNWFLLMGSK